MTTQNIQFGQPAIYITQNPVISDPIIEASQKHGFLFYKLGITQIILGIVTMAFGIALVIFTIIYEDTYPDSDYPYNYYYDWYGQIATGIWSACFVVSALTMAIFSAFVGGILFGFEIAGAIYASNMNYYYDKRWEISCGLHSALSIVAAAEIAISITHASFCCNCNCCNESDSCQTCCMPIVRENNAAVTYTCANVNNQLVQMPNSQTVQTAYVHAVPVQTAVNTQIRQQPVVMTSALPQQPVMYQMDQNSEKF